MSVDPNAAANKASVGSALIDAALSYARRGWSIIPVAGKKATGLWTPFQETAADEATLRTMFTKKGITGLAVITGRVSDGLAVRDFDLEDAYHAWREANARVAECSPTVRTSRGFHVYGCLDEEAFANLGDGELRADSGHYVLLPPSRHPSCRDQGRERVSVFAVARVGVTVAAALAVPGAGVDFQNPVRPAGHERK